MKEGKEVYEVTQRGGRGLGCFFYKTVSKVTNLKNKRQK